MEVRPGDWEVTLKATFVPILSGSSVGRGRGALVAAGGFLSPWNPCGIAQRGGDADGRWWGGGPRHSHCSAGGKDGDDGHEGRPPRRTGRRRPWEAVPGRQPVAPAGGEPAARAAAPRRRARRTRRRRRRYGGPSGPPYAPRPPIAKRGRVGLGACARPSAYGTNGEGGAGGWRDGPAAPVSRGVPLRSRGPVGCLESPLAMPLRCLPADDGELRGRR